MIHRRIAGTCVGAALALTSAPSFAYSLDFIMINNTNQPIVDFMASATQAPRYVGFDNVYVAAAGGWQRFTFRERAVGADCYVDMKMRFQGGEYWIIDHLNLCSVRAITINARNGRVSYETSE
jgi:hypothetical protein